MSTKFQTKDRYPVSAAVVMKMFSDRDFYEAKMTRLGYKHEILDSKTDGTKFSISTTRWVPIEASGIVKKILGETSEVTNDEWWDSASMTGAVEVFTKGVPLDMNATCKMYDDGDEGIVEYNWDVKARIPLGAGALEKYVVNDMQKGQAKELDAAISLADDYK